ncbi:MAG: serine--tRNA ligase [Candidatus Magasanikbacteria bacterium]|nr:serine--tRNA ligase [Candidatus Magasanikbacteria bacterium]
MLDIKYIREHAEEIKENCTKRRNKVDIDRLIAVDEIRRGLLGEVEALRAERKSGSKGKPTPEEIAKMRSLGDEIKIKEENLAAVEVEFSDLMLQVPNLTHPDSPIGGEEDFAVVFQKDHTGFDFAPKDHEELLTNLDLIDFERGAKVAAAKFYFAKNDLVRLNQALLNYGIDVVTKHGFTLMETPDLARNSILQGVGFNPRGNETQIYSVENTDLSLIGTAEITVGGYHADEILDLSNGPKKYVAMSHCFRTEAGAYGRTSKGLYRVHQFTKLEMFVYCKPEESEALHQELRAIEQEICDGLGLSYRVIDIPSGDLGGPAYRKYDLEAYMTMKGEGDKQGDFGEITSTSNCTDYQARRLNIRYRNEAGETAFVHTLNGTAVVLSRFPIAIVEQYQQADGSIKVPEVLQPYLGKAVIN